MANGKLSKRRKLDSVGLYGGVALPLLHDECDRLIERSSYQSLSFFDQLIALEVNSPADDELDVAIHQSEHDSSSNLWTTPNHGFRKDNPDSKSLFALMLDDYDKQVVEIKSDELKDRTSNETQACQEEEEQEEMNGEEEEDEGTIIQPIPQPPTSSLQPRLQRCSELLHNCDAVLILAGAGMSADSGLPTYSRSHIRCQSMASHTPLHSPMCLLVFI